ncbi:uncharacterized protein LOC129778927 [Toxorhynchites rutilus septentrionalis]|uniref:uncharacterized protein LOC129778927 n=1 Tax=Toxorhynchites rutilus septentrionalis TaxID=329112 RepID=UPI0024786621|nr:uncharacterized protein LOC129778927 [Toxorhynchites rutilus septentrionalis]
MSLSAKIDWLRKGFGKKSTAGKTKQDVEDYVGSIPKQVDREKVAIYVYKELLDVYSELNDTDEEQRSALQETLKYLIESCREADDSIRCHFLLRTYNMVVKFNGKESKRHMIVNCCRLLAQCPPVEEQLELFHRVSRVVLKVVCDLNGKKAKVKTPQEQQSMAGGLDFICSTNLQLAEQWACSDAPEVRAKAIAIFKDVFDNATALLYRLFSMEQTRAVDFYRAVVDVFKTKGRFTDREMTDLFQGSLLYLESILSLGEASKPYLQFAGFLAVFERINSEPTVSYVRILRNYLEFQSSSVADGEILISLSGKLKELSGSFCSDPLLVEIVIFITIQLRIHIDQIKQQALCVAPGIIDLCKSLIKFSKYCPRNHTQICARCGSSNRHMVDYISTMVIRMAMIMAESGQQISPDMVVLVNGFLKHKMLTLDDLNCEKKNSLLDSGLRFSVNWIRMSLQLVAGKELLDLSLLVVDFKYRYGFDFLTPSYLIRLVENCFKDVGSCQNIIDIKLVKLLMLVRDEIPEKDPSKELDGIVYAIINHQINDSSDEIRAMNIVQLIERPDFNKYNFPIDTRLTEQEKASILLTEMNWASRYKNCNIVEYFHLLRQLNADPVQLGMTIYMFQDGGIFQIPDETIEALKVSIQKFRPKSTLDKIRRHGSLGVLNYYGFGSISKEVVAKLKDCQLNKDSLKNDQINDILRENVMDQEQIMFHQLEQTYEHFRDMIISLADCSFQHFNIIYSVSQISSMLDNTCRFFQICYHPRRSVEMQLLNYILVSQKSDRALDLCCCLGFLIENFQIYQQILEDPVYRKAWVPKLDELVQKAAEIVKSNESSFASVPESRKYHFMNLYLALALYQASRNNLPDSIRHLRKLTLLLEQHSLNASALAIIRGRIYHTLFRLIVVYQAPPPRGMSVRIFIRLMLGHYNTIQKLPTDQAFIVSTSTLEMTVEALRYMMIRYDTDRIEANVEQILRFVLRRGAGLRALQILGMYASMSADGEKEDKCRMLLTYLDRLLMFRPISTDSKDQLKVISSQSTDLLDVPLITIQENFHTLDQTRKAVKHLKSPTKRSPSPNLFPEQEVDHRQYLVKHHSGCSCQFCILPQYKCQAMLAIATYARLAFLKGRISQCQTMNEAISEHWPVMKKTLGESILIGQREEYLTQFARMFMHYGQFLESQGSLQGAAAEFSKGIDILNVIDKSDPGLRKEIELNMDTLKDLEVGTDRKEHKPNFPCFVEFLKDNPLVEIDPVVEMSKLDLRTPKVGSMRVVPKTASRADDLLKQVTRKRLKTNLALEFGQESELVSAMSGLSCGSERRPKAVSIFIDSPRKPADEVENGKKQLFAEEHSSTELSPKRRGRRKKAESETPAVAKSTRKKRAVPPDSAVKTSSSHKLFKDILLKGIECSTPKIVNTVTKRCTTGKKPKLDTAYPMLKRIAPKSPEIVQNHSFNSSFRDVLLKSLSEDSKKTSLDSSVILLDDTDEEVVNTSVSEYHSVNEGSNGLLSLKKYSDRKTAAIQGSSTNKKIAKTRLQFDTSCVIDITTPVSSPVVTPTAEKSKGDSTVASKETVKRSRGRPRGCKAKNESTMDLTSNMKDETGSKSVRRKARGKN